MNRLLAASAAGVVLAASILAGCATDTQRASTTVCAATDYSCIAQAAIQYRNSAAQYHALAGRYQAEANMKATDLGDNADDVKERRQLAQQYEAKAQEADSLARQFRRELPHNMMQ